MWKDLAHEGEAGELETEEQRSSLRKWVFAGIFFCPWLQVQLSTYWVVMPWLLLVLGLGFVLRSRLIGNSSCPSVCLCVCVCVCLLTWVGWTRVGCPGPWLLTLQIASSVGLVGLRYYGPGGSARMHKHPYQPETKEELFAPSALQSSQHLDPSTGITLKP